MGAIQSEKKDKIRPNGSQKNFQSSFPQDKHSANAFSKKQQVDDYEKIRIIFNEVILEQFEGLIEPISSCKYKKLQKVNYQEFCNILMSSQDKELINLIKQSLTNLNLLDNLKVSLFQLIVILKKKYKRGNYSSSVLMMSAHSINSEQNQNYFEQSKKQEINNIVNILLGLVWKKFAQDKEKIEKGQKQKLFVFEYEKAALQSQYCAQEKYQQLEVINQQKEGNRSKKGFESEQIKKQKEQNGSNTGQKQYLSIFQGIIEESEGIQKRMSQIQVNQRELPTPSPEFHLEKRSTNCSKLQSKNQEKLFKIPSLSNNQISEIQEDEKKKSIIRQGSIKVYSSIFQNGPSIKQNVNEWITKNNFSTIKYLKLRCYKQKFVDFLTQSDIKKLINLNMPFLEFIDLSGNRIQDEGVHLLCQKQSKTLKEVNLNNNRITIKGFSHIIKCKWNEGVKYILDVVQSSENFLDGLINIEGAIISNVKNILQETVDGISYLFDKYSEHNQGELYRALQLVMMMPIEEDENIALLNSEKLEKSLYENSIKNRISISSAILTIKNILSQGTDVLFSQKTNLLTQLTCKILLCGIQDQRIKFKHKIESKEWPYQDFKDNCQKLIQFKKYYLNYLSKTYYVNPDDIAIHKITKGSTEVWVSVNPNNFILRNQKFAQNENITVVPFFQRLCLSPSDFDSKGNFTFPAKEKSDIQYRGGIAYFQPVHCTRFGVKVLGLYDINNDDWLSMKGIPKEWAVGFHGIKQPHIQATKNKNNLTIMQSIMRGREGGEMLIAGTAQAYSNSQSKNKPGQSVGSGIYISPYFTTCLLQYTRPVKLDDHSFRVLLQCRFKPQSLKCTPKDDYWVINKSKDIRPYGIILFSEEQVNKIKQLNVDLVKNSLFSLKCGWLSLKDKYEQFRKKNKLPL